jgi:hypothetical protein
MQEERGRDKKKKNEKQRRRKKKYTSSHPEQCRCWSTWRQMFEVRGMVMF